MPGSWKAWVLESRGKAVSPERSKSLQAFEVSSLQAIFSNWHLTCLTTDYVYQN